MEGGAALVQAWADDNALGPDPGARVLAALASDTGEGAARGTRAQPGCTFARRSLGVCDAPACAAGACHVRVTLRAPSAPDSFVVRPSAPAKRGPGAGA